MGADNTGKAGKVGVCGTGKEKVEKERGEQVSARKKRCKSVAER